MNNLEPLQFGSAAEGFHMYYIYRNNPLYVDGVLNSDIDNEYHIMMKKYYFSCQVMRLQILI